jgi:hypothetical protein
MSRSAAGVPMLTDESLHVIPGRARRANPEIPLRNLEICGFAADAALSE